jgi:heptose-I-phosphate ethanolaminephosphotransferase
MFSINKFVTRSLAELKANYVLALHLLLLSVVVYLPYIFRFPEDAIGISRVSVFLAVGLLLIAFIQRFAYFVFCIVLAAVNLVYMHVSANWGFGYFAARMEAYLESPPSEEIDYLHSHMGVSDYLLLVVAFGYLAYLIFVIFRRYRNMIYLKRIAAIALVVWIAIFFSFRLEHRITRIAPFSFVTGVFSANERYEILSSRLEYIEQHPLSGITCNSKYKKIVIVVGESAISDNMSAFGYPKPTTPFFDRSEPHAFDALSPSNQTRFALAMALTAAGPGDFNRFYRDHSLVSMLRACGYYTTWVSNQAPDSAHNAFASSLAGEAHEQIYLSNMSWRRRPYDGEVVTELEKRGAFHRENHAVFVQLMGSHKIYRNRYPPGFGFQSVTDTVGEYDNSLLYTDSVIADLYDRFDGEDLLFIYFSDHGQLVTNNRSGSGFFPGYKEEFRVPLLIWTDDGKAIDQIRSAIGDKKLNMSSFSDLAQYLVGTTDQLNISTSEMVSVLAPEDPTAYRDLKSIDDR